MTRDQKAPRRAATANFHLRRVATAFLALAMAGCTMTETAVRVQRGKEVSKNTREWREDPAAIVSTLSQGPEAGLLKLGVGTRAHCFSAIDTTFEQYRVTETSLTPTGSQIWKVGLYSGGLGLGMLAFAPSLSESKQDNTALGGKVLIGLGLGILAWSGIAALQTGSTSAPFTPEKVEGRTQSRDCDGTSPMGKLVIVRSGSDGPSSAELGTFELDSEASAQMPKSSTIDRLINTDGTENKLSVSLAGLSTPVHLDASLRDEIQSERTKRSVSFVRKLRSEVNTANLERLQAMAGSLSTLGQATGYYDGSDIVRHEVEVSMEKLAERIDALEDAEGRKAEGRQRRELAEQRRSWSTRVAGALSTCDRIVPQIRARRGEMQRLAAQRSPRLSAVLDRNNAWLAENEPVFEQATGVLRNVMDEMQSWDEETLQDRRKLVQATASRCQP